MSLGVTSGIVTIVSGPSQPQFTTENIGTELYASGGRLSAFLGGDGNYALNVNISGGNVSVSISGGIQTQIPGYQSGTLVSISGGAGSLSGLNVTAAVTISPFAYQSGTEVGISGGQAALSGLYVVISGGVSATIPALQSGTLIEISGGQLALSGLNVITGLVIPSLQSGTMVIISGGFPVATPIPALQSGTMVIISGGVTVSGDINVIALNNFRVSGSPLLLTAASGGVALPNLTSKSVLISNYTGNTALFIGSTTDAPYSASGGAGQSITSGAGYPLEGGNSISIDVANPSTIRVVHTTSGSPVGYAVVMS